MGEGPRLEECEELLYAGRQKVERRGALGSRLRCQVNAASGGWGGTDRPVERPELAVGEFELPIRVGMGDPVRANAARPVGREPEAKVAGLGFPGTPSR